MIYVQGVRDREVEGRLLALAPAVYFAHTFTGTCISGSKTFTRPSAAPCDRAFGWPCLVQYFPRGCGGRSPLTMWRQFTWQSAQLALLREYGAVLTHSRYMRNEMIKHGVPTDTVAYPVREHTLPPSGHTGTWRLLFAGRMTRLKGGRYLLEALPGVVSALQRPLHVSFAGDGSERGSLEARAREIVAGTPGLSIEFVGWLADEGLASLLAETDLLVVPSLWPEPFGSIGPIAGRYSVPAAAFDVGGIREWLVDGVGGHLASGNPPTADGLAHAIVRCLADRAHYTQLRKGALDVSARFTMRRHLCELLPVLQRVADEQRRS